jgi:nitrile hydratase
MGGMHGFGPVEAEEGEPVFHEPWEGRTFGLAMVTLVNGLTTGSGRHAIESIPPAEYLASSYYERWAASLEARLIAKGTLTRAEIDARAATVDAEPTRSEGASPDMVAALPRFLDSPQATSGVEVPCAFSVGDRVTVKRMAPAAHHRCPRYVRGVTGTVTHIAGGWAHPGDEEPEAVCTVRFAMADVWGADAEPGHLYIDLWERYLG